MITPVSENKIIIFSDLDGTLLDPEYSYSGAEDSLKIIHQYQIPLVLCSSKTRAEMEKIRSMLHNSDPFISENGGGIFIPYGYFASIPYISEAEVFRDGKYTVIKLGESYRKLRYALLRLRKAGFNVRGFGDMSPEEISSLTGLNISDAKKAKKREFDEPFVFKGTEIEELNMIKMIHDMGLEYTQGEYYHLMGRSDKGRAVRILKDLFRNEYGDVITIALGDGLNDLNMLKEADYPVLIKKPDGSYDYRVKFKGLRRARGIGPHGWNRAVKKLLYHLKLSSSEGKAPRSTSPL